MKISIKGLSEIGNGVDEFDNWHNYWTATEEERTGADRRAERRERAVIREQQENTVTGTRESRRSKTRTPKHTIPEDTSESTIPAVAIAPNQMETI